MKPTVTGFYDAETATVTYLVRDPGSRFCAVIDPVLDYDARSGRTTTGAAEAVAKVIRADGLTLAWILETHAHADHITAAPYFKDAFGAPVGIGAAIAAVQETWKGIYNYDGDFPADGSQFDRLFVDGDRFTIGDLAVTVWHTPGHTPACVTYLVGDAAFVGDTLFMPDGGTARVDFPGGDGRTLYDSIRRILSLPGETRIFVGHDYQPGGRAIAFETSVAAERADNIHVRDGVSADDYVALRAARDATLKLPRLLLPALQVNIRAGRFPPAEDNGTVYLKIPVDRL